MNTRIACPLIALCSLGFAVGCSTEHVGATRLRDHAAAYVSKNMEGPGTAFDGHRQADPYIRSNLAGVSDPMDPSPTSGSINIPPGSFLSGNNNQTCFPAANGWDRYYTTFYFLGPNTTPPNPNNYPNTYNDPILEITTNDPANGTLLEAGVVIIDNLNPNSKVCSPTTPGSPKLGTAVFNPMGNSRKYRATIFYKSATMPAGMTNVVMRWTYHN